MSKFTDPNFQGRSVRAGRFVQQMAERAITGAGFRVLEQNQVFGTTGATVNFTAAGQDGAVWHFDVIGAVSSPRAGLMRTDSVWKALGRASVLSTAGCQRLILLTTNLPKPGSVGHRALKTAASTYFDAVELLAPEGRDRLRRYAEGTRHIPLPGFYEAQDLYPGLTETRISGGRRRIEVPVIELEDGLPARRLAYDVETLPYRVQVVVPTQDSLGVRLPKPVWDKAAHRIQSLLFTYGGGTTSMEALGAWADPVGGVMHEQVFVVESYAASPLASSTFWALVEVIVGDLRQHAAAMVINDHMTLVTRAEGSSESDDPEPGPEQLSLPA